MSGRLVNVPNISWADALEQNEIAAMSPRSRDKALAAASGAEEAEKRTRQRLAAEAPQRAARAASAERKAAHKKRVANFTKKVAARKIQKAFRGRNKNTSRKVRLHRLKKQIAARKIQKALGRHTLRRMGKGSNKTLANFRNYMQFLLGPSHRPDWIYETQRNAEFPGYGTVRTRQILMPDGEYNIVTQTAVPRYPESGIKWITTQTPAGIEYNRIKAEENATKYKEKAEKMARLAEERAKRKAEESARLQSVRRAAEAAEAARIAARKPMTQQEIWKISAIVATRARDDEINRIKQEEDEKAASIPGYKKLTQKQIKAEAQKVHDGTKAYVEDAMKGQTYATAIEALQAIGLPVPEQTNTQLRRAAAKASGALEE